MTAPDGSPEPAWSPPTGPSPFGPVGPGPEADRSSPADNFPSSAPDAMTADRHLLASPARQSAIAVIFIAWRFIRGLGAVQIGLAVVFIVSGRVPLEVLGLGFVAALVGLAIMLLSWWRFTFEVEGDELVVNKGILAQERLTIPLDRVQSVSISQSFIHRFVGVVSAGVDTAGSSDTEFQIDAVGQDQAEALQRLVAGHRRVRTDSPGAQQTADPLGASSRQLGAEDEVIIHRTPMELVRVGATRWPWAGLVALFPLLALLDDLQGILPLDFLDEEVIFEGSLPSGSGPRVAGLLVLVVVVVLVVGAVLGTLLQIVREVVTNWDLKLLRTETGLRRTAGLLNTTSRASTLSRIQSIETNQTPAQRFFGIRRLNLPTIGDGDIAIPGAVDEEISTVRDLTFGARADANGIVEPPALDRMISRLAVFLATRNAVAMIIPIFGLAFFQVRWWALLVLAVVPFQWLVARRRWRLRRWSISDWQIAESHELVSKHTAEVDLIKTQTVTVSRSFFERRRGLATVWVETAEGALTVPLITVDEANAVRDRALFVAESDRRTWM